VRSPAENKLKGKHLLVRCVPIIFISITIHFGGSYSLTILHLVHLKRQIIYTKKTEKSRPLRTYNLFRFVDGLRINLKFGAKKNVLTFQRCLLANHHVMLSGHA